MCEGRGPDAVATSTPEGAAFLFGTKGLYCPSKKKKKYYHTLIISSRTIDCPGKQKSPASAKAGVFGGKIRSTGETQFSVTYVCKAVRSNKLCRVD